MLPESSCAWHGFITAECKGFEQFVESYDTSFLESVHSFVYFTVHKSIRGNVYVVFVLDLLGNIGWVDAQVLMVGHVRSKV